MATFAEKHPKLQSFLQGVGGAAPEILKGLGSVPVVGSALSMIGDAIGKTEALSADQKAAALSIAKEEDDYNLAMAQAAEKDAESARQREMAIATSDKAPLINKVATPVLGFFIVFAFFGMLSYMLIYDVPSSNKDILNMMLGSLGTMTVGVVHYYFASSEGSKAKDAQISQMIQNQS